MLAQQVNDSLSAIYTLFEAAIIAGCTPGQLLQYGALGKVQFSVNIPEEASLFSIDESLLLWAQIDKETLRKFDQYSLQKSRLQKKLLHGRLNGLEPIEVAGVEMLLISKFDCETVIRRRKCRQSVFKSGFRFDDQSQPALINPLLPPDYSDIGFGEPPFLSRRYYATYLKKDKDRVPDYWKQIDLLHIEIMTDNLWVTGFHLQCFLQESGLQTEKKASSLNGILYKVEQPACLIKDQGEMGGNAKNGEYAVEQRKLDKAHQPSKRKRIAEELSKYKTDVIATALKTIIDRDHDGLTPLIVEAFKASNFSLNKRTVWIEFRKMAMEVKPAWPLIGPCADGVKYQAGEDSQVFHRTNFGHRLDRMLDRLLDHLTKNSD